jgi:PEP-CTERM motif
MTQFVLVDGKMAWRPGLASVAQRVLSTSNRVALGVVAALALSSAASASDLVVSGGVLTGIHGISFEGSLYDVDFTDGLCGAGCGTPFTHAQLEGFTATLKAEFPEGSTYDLAPQNILGCEGAVSQCQIYMRSGGTIGWRTTVVKGASAANTYSVLNALGSNHDTATQNFQTWANVSVSAVPEASTLAMLGLGMAVLALRRRRIS